MQAIESWTHPYEPTVFSVIANNKNHNILSLWRTRPLWESVVNPAPHAQLTSSSPEINTVVEELCKKTHRDIMHKGEVGGGGLIMLFRACGWIALFPQCYYVQYEQYFKI